MVGPYVAVASNATVDILDSSFVVKGQYTVHGPVDYLATSGQLLFVAYNSVIPGHTAVEVGLIRCFDMTSGAFKDMTVRVSPWVGAICLCV